MFELGDRGGSNRASTVIRLGGRHRDFFLCLVLEVEEKVAAVVDSIEFDEGHVYVPLEPVGGVLQA